MPRRDAAARPPTEDPELECARKIVELRGRPLFVWSDVATTIDWSFLARLREEFEGVGELPELDVLLHSPGGDIHTAYRCLRVFRRKARRVTFLVPFWAKSAATFMTLGGEEILIGKDGELGPLDAQLDDPEGGDDPLSALNEFKSLEYVRDFAIETHDVFFFHLREKSTMDIPHALDRAEQMVDAFSGRLFSQFQSRALGKYRRLLQVAEDYGRVAMRRWGYTELKEERIKEIVRNLVWDYPAHEFVIDLAEAQRIGLNAKPMDEPLEELAWRVVENHKKLFKLISFTAADSTKAAEPASMEIKPDQKTIVTAANGGTDGGT